MSRKSKYVILTIALLTVLAAILVSLGGRLGTAEDPQETEGPVAPDADASQTPGAPPSAPVPPDMSGAAQPPSMTPPPAPEPEATPEPETYAVVVTAGPGGTVEPRGLVSVRKGGSVSFTFTPDEGFEVSEVKVDGQSVTSPAGYVFSNVNASHTLYVVFRAGAEPEPEPEPGETPEPEPPDTTEPVEGGDVVSGFLG